MATYVPPKKNTQWIGYISLASMASAGRMDANPTIAAGDFKVSTDGGSLANLGTLPTVTPASGKMVKVTLSTSEMNGDNVTVVCSDQTDPPEWADVVFNLQTAARQVEDLAYPATSGRSMVVDAAGLVDANAVKLGPTGAGTAQTARDLGAGRVQKNAALANFVFYMIDSTDLHSPKTGLTVACQRSIDGGAFANCTNTPATEIANGYYKISLSAADLNGDVIALKFTATGAEVTALTLVTQP